MVRTEFRPANQWPRILATCPRIETAPRQPMASARYIRAVSLVASQSRIVSAAITQKATVLAMPKAPTSDTRSEEHTSELQSRLHLVCRLLLEKKTTRASTPE